MDSSPSSPGSTRSRRREDDSSALAGISLQEGDRHLEDPEVQVSQHSSFPRHLYAKFPASQAETQGSPLETPNEPITISSDSFVPTSSLELQAITGTAQATPRSIPSNAKRYRTARSLGGRHLEPPERDLVSPRSSRPLTSSLSRASHGRERAAAEHLLVKDSQSVSESGPTDPGSTYKDPASARSSPRFAHFSDVATRRLEPLQSRRLPVHEKSIPAQPLRSTGRSAGGRVQKATPVSLKRDRPSKSEIAGSVVPVTGQVGHLSSSAFKSPRAPHFHRRLRAKSLAVQSPSQAQEATRTTQGQSLSPIPLRHSPRLQTQASLPGGNLQLDLSDISREQASQGRLSLGVVI